MNDDVLAALTEHLTAGITLPEQRVPDALRGTAYVREKHPDPVTCPADGCPALIKSRLSSEAARKRRYACHEGHIESVPLADLARYQFQPEPTLKALADHLGLTPTECFETELPKYVSVATDERIDLCLIGNPLKYDAAIEAQIKRAIREHRVTVLLVPQDSIQPVLEVAKSYPLGSLVCPLPLALLTNTSLVREIVSNARLARNRTEAVLERRGIAFNETIDQLAENPPLITAALTYLRVLREQQPPVNGLGAELEKVCKAAFASMGVVTHLEAGGTADRGEKVPDIVVGFDADSTPSNDYPKALGIVDAKSGSTGRFSSEKIVGKHTSYLQQARRKEAYRGWHLCHIFVVFDIDGYKELDWFDQIREAYPGYDDDVTMVVLYADALRELVSAAHNVVQHAELKQATGDLQRVYRPLFDHSQHDADWVPSEIASMVRVDTTNPSPREEEYIREYHRRSQLLVVTPKMVHHHLRRCAQTNDWDTLLDDYFT